MYYPHRQEARYPLCVRGAILARAQRLKSVAVLLRTMAVQCVVVPACICATFVCVVYCPRDAERVNKSRRLLTNSTDTVITTTSSSGWYTNLPSFLVKSSLDQRKPVPSRRLRVIDKARSIYKLRV